MELIFVESGGDKPGGHLASPERPPDDLRHRCVGGDKIPCKGGLGITKSDLLVINKIDLAPMVGASPGGDGLGREKDARRAPFIFSNLKTNQAWPRSSPVEKQARWVGCA